MKQFTMKNKIPKSFYLILIIAVVAISLVIFIQSKLPVNQENQSTIQIASQPATTSIESQIDISDWEIYEDKRYGFEFKFPKDWKVELLAKGIELKSLLSDSKLTILEARNEKGLSLDEWFRKISIVGGRPTINALAVPITLNGYRAYKLDSGLQPPNPSFEVFIADNQRRIFVLSAYSANLTDSTILNTILLTFRFLASETSTYQNQSSYKGRNENLDDARKKEALEKIKKQEQEMMERFRENLAPEEQKEFTYLCQKKSLSKKDFARLRFLYEKLLGGPISDEKWEQFKQFIQHEKEIEKGVIRMYTKAYRRR